jgi:hypothetical protein
MKMRKEKEGEAEVTCERTFGNYLILNRIRTNVRIRGTEEDMRHVLHYQYIIRNVSAKFFFSFEKQKQNLGSVSINDGKPTAHCGSVCDSQGFSKSPL